MAVDKISAPALFPGRAMLNIDGARRVLRVGQTSPEGVKLVDANSKRAVIELNGVRKEIRLGGHIGGTFASRERQVVQIWPDLQRMYTTSGSVNGRPINFLVDTGATSIVFNSNHARSLGIDFRARGKVGTASTASGLTKIYSLTVASVRIGTIELRNVPTSVTEGDFPEIPLLGMSFLSRVDMRREGLLLELIGK